MYTRPKDGQEVVVGKEWLDRRSGQTDQFLTATAMYVKDTDSLDICSYDALLKTVPARFYHWWMPVYSPVGVWTHRLVAADWWRRGMRGEFLVS